MSFLEEEDEMFGEEAGEVFEFVVGSAGVNGEWLGSSRRLQGHSDCERTGGGGGKTGAGRGGI